MGCMGTLQGRMCRGIWQNDYLILVHLTLSPTALSIVELAQSMHARMHTCTPPPSLPPHPPLAVAASHLHRPTTQHSAHRSSLHLHLASLSHKVAYAPLAWHMLIDNGQHTFVCRLWCAEHLDGLSGTVALRGRMFLTLGLAGWKGCYCFIYYHLVKLCYGLT
jgi:hypothetical protein